MQSASVWCKCSSGKMRLQGRDSYTTCCVFTALVPNLLGACALQVAAGRQLSFPTGLPKPVLPPGQTVWPQKFGLSDRLAHGVLLQQQLTQLCSYLTAAQNLSNPRPALASKTWTDTYLKKLMCFLGFCSFCRKPSMLCLELLLDHQLLLQFFSYQLQKQECYRTTFGQFVSTFRAALEFLQQQSQHHSDASQRHIQNTLELLLRLKVKLSPSLALSKPVSLRQVQQEFSAEQTAGQLMLAIDAMLTEAQQKILVEPEWEYPTARVVHDALLLALLFGHLPSIRESMLITLQQPGVPGEAIQLQSGPVLQRQLMCQELAIRPWYTKLASQRVGSLPSYLVK